MKKRLASQLALGLLLVALPFLGGCTQPDAGGSNPFVSSANAEPVGGENDLAAVTTAATNVSIPAVEMTAGDSSATNSPAAGPATNLPALAGTVAAAANPAVESKPPPNLQLSPVLSEVVKLVQSGVDESVLFAYVTNTTGYFSLGAEEIVYLNDLGVASEVITTMMEHDKALRELRMNAWQAAQVASAPPATPAPQPAEPAPEPEVTAAAPTYVEAPAMQAEPVYVSNNYFYDTLSPYGSWVYVTGYGRCWRPTVALCNPAWRPYADRGRWVYSDCGWYWLSDYTWGATAFHYGRWFNAPSVGWCWWPDTVWAPSWVSWRYTSDYCGWAPLPPTAGYQAGFGLMFASGSVGVSFGFGLGYSDYAFVPWGSFCGPQPYRYCVPANQAVNVYNHSTPVNHLEAGGSGQVYNRGISPDRVRHYSRTEVRPVPIRENSGQGQRNEQLTRNGRALEVRRPQFTTASTGTASATRTSQRMSERGVPAPTKPSVVANSPSSSPATQPPRSGRVEYQSRSEQVAIGRPPTRPNMPLAPSEATKPYAGRIEPVRTRVEQRNSPLPQPPTEAVTANRPHATAPPARVPQPTPTENRSVKPPVVNTAPVSKPLPSRAPQATPHRIELRPAAPSRNNSVVVIGGENSTRSGGRDYSVWSTPAPVPARSTPRGNYSIRSIPEVAENSPTPVSRPPISGNWPNRSPDRTYSSSPARPELTPSAPPTPVYNQSRPTPSRVTPNYTPRAQPAPARSEPRPSPAAPRPANPGPPSR